MPNITLFDFDHTLISVDCSNEWTKYLCQQNFVNNPKAYMATKNAYARAYLEGQVDMLGFSRFILNGSILVSIFITCSWPYLKWRLSARTLTLVQIG